jgi:methionyl-tRNA formyltransferase
LNDGHRVVLAGNNAAAVGVLDLLLETLPARAILTVAPPVVSGSDWQTSLSDASAERGVECITPRDVNDDQTLARVKEHGARLLLSIYYTQLFRAALLAAIDGPTLNFHPSLLPRHRGHAPLIWAIAEGDSVTGLSVHHIDAGIDTGALVSQRSIPIHPLETGYELHRKMRFLVKATAADLLRRWLADKPLPVAAEQTGVVSVHTRRDPQLNHLAWDQPRERIRNIVRALAPPLPGAFVVYEGREITLVDVEAVPEVAVTTRTAGMLEQDFDGYPIVWALDGPLRIRAAMLEGDLVDARDLSLLTGAVLR